MSDLSFLSSSEESRRFRTAGNYEETARENRIWPMNALSRTVNQTVTWQQWLSSKPTNELRWRRFCHTVDQTSNSIYFLICIFIVGAFIVLSVCTNVPACIILFMLENTCKPIRLFIAWKQCIVESHKNMNRSRLKNKRKIKWLFFFLVYSTFSWLFFFFEVIFILSLSDLKIKRKINYQ